MALLKDRDYAEKAVISIARTMLTADNSESRNVLEEILAVSSDALAGGAAELALEHFPPGDQESYRDFCRKQLLHIVFPDSEGREGALVERKFDVLAEHLEFEDLSRLRTWLMNGLVLFPEESHAVRDDEEVEATRAAVTRIRRAASHCLGVPLVSWRELPPGVTLDLIPAA